MTLPRVQVSNLRNGADRTTSSRYGLIWHQHWCQTSHSIVVSVPNPRTGSISILTTKLSTKPFTHAAETATTTTITTTTSYAGFINHQQCRQSTWLTNKSPTAGTSPCTRPAKTKYEPFSNMEHSKNHDSTRAKDALARSRQLIQQEATRNNSLQCKLVSNWRNFSDRSTSGFSTWPDTKSDVKLQNWSFVITLMYPTVELVAARADWQSKLSTKPTTSYQLDRCINVYVYAYIDDNFINQQCRQWALLDIRNKSSPTCLKH